MDNLNQHGPNFVGLGKSLESGVEPFDVSVQNEPDHWAYAKQDITAGEKLTMDYNRYSYT